MYGPASSLKSLLLFNLSKCVMRSTGGVASILAASDDDMVRSSVACIVAENAFSSPESVARQTVSEVVFKVLVCKGSSTAYAIVYPIMLMVKALSVIKVLHRLHPLLFTTALGSSNGFPLRRARMTSPS